MTGPNGLNLWQWIEEHAHLLRPPVGNAQIWPHTDLMITVVAGPNQRMDFHDDPGEEFFFQMRGDMTLRVREPEGCRSVAIREGDVYLLPPHVRHSPQRPEPGSVGLVVERRRAVGELDGFEWYCPQCDQLLHRAEVALSSIVADLPPLFRQFYGDPEQRACRSCGTHHPAPGEPGFAQWRVPGSFNTPTSSF